MNTGDLQLTKPWRARAEACWNETGVQGDGSCPELEQVVHCRNCPTYARAGAQLLDRPLLPQYRRDWTEHFAQEKKLTTPAETSALVFRIQAEWLALPTQAFQEVAERRLVHSLPHRRQGPVLGLVNIRGELLICVSLGQLIAIGQSVRASERQSVREPAHASTLDSLQRWTRVTHRLLVTRWEGQRFVFPADEVRGIHRFEMPELTEPPITVAKSRLRYTQGMLSWQGHAVGLLDADLLFSAINRNLT